METRCWIPFWTFLILVLAHLSLLGAPLILGDREDNHPSDFRNLCFCFVLLCFVFLRIPGTIGIQCVQIQAFLKENLHRIFNTIPLRFYTLYHSKNLYPVLSLKTNKQGMKEAFLCLLTVGGLFRFPMIYTPNNYILECWVPHSILFHRVHFPICWIQISNILGYIDFPYREIGAL